MSLIAPGCDIVQVEGITDGAARTTLLAEQLIDNNEPLLMANSDQFVEWNSNECIYAFTADSIDGGIITFEATHPKWSFAKLGKDGFVSEVAEKNPISNLATAGIYYWKHGSDYVKYVKQMIDNETRVVKPLSSGSGYERTISSLAIRSVLTKVSSLPKPNIVVMDEVFGKIADDNLEMVGEFFKKIKEYFEHIFVISHNPLIRNWSDNIIMVKKEENVSSIEYVTTKIS